MEELKNIDFNYSLKHIPLTTRQVYMIKLYDATFKFINRLKWKIFFSNNKDN